MKIVYLGICLVIFGLFLIPASFIFSSEPRELEFWEEDGFDSYDEWCLSIDKTWFDYEENLCKPISELPENSRCDPETGMSYEQYNINGSGSGGCR